MSEWAYENDYRWEGNGSYHSLIPDGARHFGLKAEGCTVNEPQRIVDALANGKLVVAGIALLITSKPEKKPIKINSDFKVGE